LEGEASSRALNLESFRRPVYRHFLYDIFWLDGSHATQNFVHKLLGLNMLIVDDKRQTILNSFDGVFTVEAVCRASLLTAEFLLGEWRA